MQAVLIRDDLAVGPNAKADSVREWAEMREVTVNGRRRKRLYWKRGAIINNPRAFRLVQQGVAIPHDDECRLAAECSEDQLAAAQKAYERVSRGIHPEDYALFDAGVISGYQDDGSYKPGPNAAMAPDVFEDEDDEDDE